MSFSGINRSFYQGRQSSPQHLAGRFTGARRGTLNSFSPKRDQNKMTASVSVALEDGSAQERSCRHTEPAAFVYGALYPPGKPVQSCSCWSSRSHSSGAAAAAAAAERRSGRAAERQSGGAASVRARQAQQIHCANGWKRCASLSGGHLMGCVTEQQRAQTCTSRADTHK